MKKLFQAGILLLAFAVACEKTPSTEIITDKDIIQIGFEGGKDRIHVDCESATKTTIKYETGEGWIFLMPTYLKPGGGWLDFQINRFNVIGETRTAVAEIVAGDNVKSIQITQSGKAQPEATDLDLDKYNVYAEVEGGSFDIEVTAATAWTATCDESWLTIKNGSSASSGKFTIEVPASEDFAYRAATVKVSLGQITREVLVQHGGVRICDRVWATSNGDDPDTFTQCCDERGKLYQYNSKVGFPSYSADDHGDTETVVPGFEGGQVDVHSEVWAEEYDPCPAGWRVPSKSEFEALLSIGTSTTPYFYFDFYKAQGMAVAGAFVGLDREILKECTKADMQGAIFIPQAGMINRDDCKQGDWWDAAVWTATNVGQTWDMWGLWLNGNQDYGFAWWGSRTGASVRCVWNQ
ncbi:MAG: BACON domain-containing protein [Bacteroidales bacterium]|nr:BACON domain-containing protein [Bacteroidales bacterium]